MALPLAVRHRCLSPRGFVWSSGLLCPGLAPCAPYHVPELACTLRALLRPFVRAGRVPMLPARRRGRPRRMAGALHGVPGAVSLGVTPPSALTYWRVHSSGNSPWTGGAESPDPPTPPARLACGKGWVIGHGVPFNRRHLTAGRDLSRLAAGPARRAGPACRAHEICTWGYHHAGRRCR